MLILDVKKGASLYEALVLQEIASYQKHGVNVVIARHGFKDGYFGITGIEERDVESLFGRLCRGQRVSCIDLDTEIQAHSNKDEKLVLADGHWNIA